MKNRQTSGHLSVIGKLPEGYIILCRLNGDEYSFLAKTLGISVECPHCGATRCGSDLAQELYLGSAKTENCYRIGVPTDATVGECKERPRRRNQPAGLVAHGESRMRLSPSRKEY